MSHAEQFIHRFEAGDTTRPMLLALHGTGGDENDLVPLEVLGASAMRSNTGGDNAVAARLAERERAGGRCAGPIEEVAPQRRFRAGEARLDHGIQSTGRGPEGR